MNKNILMDYDKMKKYILIVFGVSVVLALSLILYLEFNCRCTSHTYYQLKNRVLYYNKIDTYIEENKDSIVDWNALIRSDTTLDIIFINNKKDSLEFIVIAKDTEKDRVSYYYNGEYHLYRILPNRNEVSKLKEYIYNKLDN
jgi:hypothetical protein